MELENAYFHNKVEMSPAFPFFLFADGCWGKVLFTSWSYYELTNFFGIGFLSPSQTIGVWFAELFVYILLAHIEELCLSKNCRESFDSYRNHVPLLIPFIKTNKKGLGILISVILPAILLFGLILLHPCAHVFF